MALPRAVSAIAAIVCMVWFAWNGFTIPSIVICGLIVMCIVKWGSPRNRLQISGKAVFITGCDSGFGHLTARRLSSLGCTVFATCLNPLEGGAKDLQSIENIHVIKCDVTVEAEVREAKEFVESHLSGKGLWAVVNNAGVAVFSPLEWIPVSDFERMMSVNAIGVVRVTKTFLPLLRRSRGRVINVASLAGRFNLPFFSAYSMSKSACIAFSDCLRREMAPFRVSVSTIEPTLYSTNIIAVDRITQQATNNWETSADEVKRAYGQTYFEHFTKRTITNALSRSLPNVGEVVDDLIEAVCAEQPKTRYVPNLRVRIKVFLMALLPDRWLDRILRVGGESILAKSHR